MGGASRSPQRDEPSERLVARNVLEGWMGKAAWLLDVSDDHFYHLWSPPSSDQTTSYLYTFLYIVCFVVFRLCFEHPELPSPFS